MEDPCENDRSQREGRGEQRENQDAEVFPTRAGIVSDGRSNQTVGSIVIFLYSDTFRATGLRTEISSPIPAGSTRRYARHFSARPDEVEDPGSRTEHALPNRTVARESSASPAATSSYRPRAQSGPARGTFERISPRRPARARRVSRGFSREDEESPRAVAVIEDDEPVRARDSGENGGGAPSRAATLRDLPGLEAPCRRQTGVPSTRRAPARRPRRAVTLRRERSSSRPPADPSTAPRGARRRARWRRSSRSRTPPGLLRARPDRNPSAERFFPAPGARSTAARLVRAATAGWSPSSAFRNSPRNVPSPAPTSTKSERAAEDRRILRESSR